MTDFPRSLIEFQQRFGDEAACAQYLIATRWPDGFVCPVCGGGKGWLLETKAWTYECASCGRQTSVTAGTIMHHSKLPLTAWFWAAYLMATHSNGISALQLQRQLAFGSYKTAWLICAKLRSSMLAPDRSPLAGLVEVDETEIACRSKNDPVTGGGGRSHQGKILVVGAVEVEGIEEALALLAKVGLHDKRDAFPARLSGGQKQRVGIARALAMRPDLLLFDEPTSALDPELVGEVLLVMRELAHEGMTMVIVTHEMTFAREAATRVLFLDHGRVVETGAPDAFFARPTTERARQFLQRYAAEAVTARQ